MTDSAGEDETRMLEIAETQLTEGQIVGDRYRLLQIIGEGGMGVVWAARDTEKDEERALKFIRRDRGSDVRNEARLLREAKALSTISHVNVARVFEVSELPDGTPFLVMERLVGETLKQRIARLGRLELDDSVRVARGIATGVEAAHAMGIVHRDLKPDNVFIEDDGTVKVLDFGIAKELRSSDGRSDTSLTTTGAMLGTLHYMAPEQVFGDTDVDERADVWALGIVIVECLSGKKPTDGSGSGQVLKAIMTKEFERLDQVVQECPPQIADLVELMLSRERDERPLMSDVITQLSLSGDARASRPSARFSRRTSPTSSKSKPEREAVAEAGASSSSSARSVSLLVGLVVVALASAGAYTLRARGPEPTGPTTATSVSAPLALPPTTESTKTAAPSTSTLITPEPPPVMTTRRPFPAFPSQAGAGASRVPPSSSVTPAASSVPSGRPSPSTGPLPLSTSRT